MMKMILKCVCMSLLWPQFALATKPCPPLKCIDNKGNFNAPLCLNKADWVATGIVNNISSNVQPQPMNNRQYQFNFTSNKFEKGNLSRPLVSFVSGWCHNRMWGTLNDGALIKMYGLYGKGQYGKELHKKALHSKAQFIGYEVLDTKR